MPLGLVPAMVPIPAQTRCAEDVAPPKGFRAAEGVRSAWLIGEGPFGRTPDRLRGTAAQRNGKRYERQALAYLAGVLGRGFTPSQWFKYHAGALHAPRYCQTDGIFVDDSGVVIFEVKASFTESAYWQLRWLYEPVIRAALNPKRVQLIVVCRSFDPAISFPAPYERTDLLKDWRERLTKIGVFQWSKK